ncbi:hypothetical protein ACOMHN_009940 [Nucella lapillus]
MVATCLIVCSQGVLEDKLTYYEVLQAHNVLARSRRSIGPHHQLPRQGHELTITIFNMTLVCHLYPRKNLFTSSFRLVVIDGDRKNMVSDFDTQQFLVGTCEDDVSSDVHGYFSDGVFEGRIKYNGVVYGIEEAKRHIHEKGKGEYRGKMIAYRSSDIIWDRRKGGKGPSFCGASHVDEPGHYSKFGVTIETLEEPVSRVKRATVPDNWSTCRVIAVADYNFYRYIGGNNIYSTAAYIGSVMERVDGMYRSTVFNLGDEITGLGFEIAEIWINTVPTSGFNADMAEWEPLKLLQAFGRDLYFRDFCLAHLFTHRQFAGNVLGLAYIAAETIGSAGGICSPTRKINGTETALNTGWSTTLNSNGDTVLSEQAQLVTAHGHNWGAEHDPDTDACTPSSMFGNGKYLMYAYSVNGYDSNNYKFSPCSRSDIAAVLSSKAKGCFSESPDANKTCGNGLIDEGEECDAGYLALFGLDPCCSSQCALVEKASCSPVNHECCKNCKMAAAKTPCFGDSEISCLDASYCTGDSLDCPTPPHKPRGASCLDLGRCDGKGKCQPFCEARGKVSCACDQLSQSCQRCCRDNPTSECKPYDYNHPLPNSRPCVVGYCVNGFCQKSEISLVQRLFEVFDSLSISQIIQFFRNNIVGCVMVFSLILWIPFSCCISYHNRVFLYDEDGRKLERPDGPALTSTPRSSSTQPGVMPHWLLPLVSPHNREHARPKNRVMPSGGRISLDPY